MQGETYVEGVVVYSEVVLRFLTQFVDESDRPGAAAVAVAFLERSAIHANTAVTPGPI